MLLDLTKTDGDLLAQALRIAQRELTDDTTIEAMRALHDRIHELFKPPTAADPFAELDRPRLDATIASMRGLLLEHWDDPCICAVISALIEKAEAHRTAMAEANLATATTRTSIDHIAASVGYAPCCEKHAHVAKASPGRSTTPELLAVTLAVALAAGLGALASATIEREKPGVLEL